MLSELYLDFKTRNEFTDCSKSHPYFRLGDVIWENGFMSSMKEKSRCNNSTKDKLDTN